MQFCPSLSQLRAHRVAQSVSGDGGFTLPIEESCRFTDFLHRAIEQVVEGEHSPQVQKQIACHHSCLVIAQSSILLAAQGLNLADRCCRLVMKRDQTLPLRFPCWNTQPRRPVWVRVQAVNGEAANLLAARSTPARDEERCPLIGTRQGTNGCHEPCQFIFWNIAWDTLWHLGQVAHTEQRTAGNIFPFPAGHVTKKHREA